jgi:hypothetical protein
MQSSVAGLIAGAAPLTVYRFRCQMRLPSNAHAQRRGQNAHEARIELLGFNEPLSPRPLQCVVRDHTAPAAYANCSDHCCRGPSKSKITWLRMSRPNMPRSASINKYRPQNARRRNNRSSITTGAKLLLPSKLISS